MKGARGGLLIYKCRRCGKETRIIHVPSAIVALTTIMSDGHTPKTWGMIAGSSEICNCKDGNLGMADLIGVQLDKEE